MKTRKLTKKSCLNTLYEAIADMQYVTREHMLESERRTTEWANSMSAAQFIAECESCFGYTHTDEDGFAV